MGSIILGHDSEVAFNGLEAFNLLKEKGTDYYDLILMDMQMPIMDGLQATENILELYGEKAPPIIALTANAFESDRQKCLQVGMKGFLSKPLRKAALQKILEDNLPSKNVANQ